VVFDGHLVDINLSSSAISMGSDGQSSLAHLDHGRHERHLARAIDAQEGIRRERRVRGQRVADLCTNRQAEAEQQTATRGYLQKVAALHLTPPCR
jgi:hypothetical protein